jgi:hypothetical protein
LYFFAKKGGQAAGVVEVWLGAKKSNRKAPIAFVKVESGSAPVPDFQPPIISFFR